MTNTKRSYDKALKLEAVRLSETSAKSVRQIEIDLDITPGLLHKWRARARQDGERSFPGKG
jgi:transposase-like protein